MIAIPDTLGAVGKLQVRAGLHGCRTHRKHRRIRCLPFEDKTGSVKFRRSER